MAARKQSKLTKVKKSSKKVETRARSGAMDYGYTGIDDTVSYSYNHFQATKEGYIFDKQGNRHNILVSEETCDAGQYVGAGMRYNVVIDYDGVPIRLSVTRGLFDKSVGYAVVEALEQGVYLEDYLKRFVREISIMGDDREVARQIISQENNRPAEKTSVIGAIRADRQQPRQPGAKTVKTKSRTGDER